MRVDLDVILIDPQPIATQLRPSEVDRMAENVVVMHLKGPLVQGAAVSFFLDQIRLLIDRGIGNFAIDLHDVQSIDSRGVGSLAAAYNAIRDARGRVKYIHASRELHAALSRNHLDTVFEVFEDEPAALASFCEVAE